jgi:hypothetical protein
MTSKKQQPPASQGQLVPAFETSLGLGDEDAPVMVNKAALDHFNAEMTKSGRHTLSNHVEAANIAALFAKRAIRPDEIAALRREMFGVVTKHLKNVDQVLDGTKQFSNAQVRLFSVLVERVMPKLSTIAVEDPNAKKLEDLSVEELEAIVMGKKKADAIDVVVKEGDRLDRVADRTERRNANIEIKRSLAHVVGIDEAEKKYIARKATRYSLRDEEKRTLKVLAKPQPNYTEEQLANRRRAAQGGLRAQWKAQGLSDEEIDKREQERRAKISKSQNHLKRHATIRAALTMNLGDAHDLPETIAKTKSGVLKEFRVSPLKGVRKQSAILREQQQRQEKELREKERRENPRIYMNNIPGVPEGTKLRLRDLRNFRPDMFEEDKK